MLKPDSSYIALICGFKKVYLSDFICLEYFVMEDDIANTAELEIMYQNGRRSLYELRRRAIMLTAINNMIAALRSETCLVPVWRLFILEFDRAQYEIQLLESEFADVASA